MKLTKSVVVHTSSLAGVYWEWSKKKRKFLISRGVTGTILYYPRPPLRGNRCKRKNFWPHLWATEIDRGSSGTRLGKGNTQSVATKIIELHVTEQVPGVLKLSLERCQ